LNPFELV